MCEIDQDLNLNVILSQQEEVFFALFYFVFKVVTLRTVLDKLLYA